MVRKKSALFATLVNKTVIITSPGKYMTRKGEMVTVYKVSDIHRHDFGCCGEYQDGTSEGWHKSGRLYFNIESENDIVDAT